MLSRGGLDPPRVEASASAREGVGHALDQALAKPCIDCVHPDGREITSRSEEGIVTVIAPRAQKAQPQRGAVIVAVGCQARVIDARTVAVTGLREGDAMARPLDEGYPRSSDADRDPDSDSQQSLDEADHDARKEQRFVAEGRRPDGSIEDEDRFEGSGDAADEADEAESSHEHLPRGPEQSD